MHFCGEIWRAYSVFHAICEKFSINFLKNNKIP